MRTTLLLSVVAAAAILLLASPAVADGLVVWSDGSPVAGAKVVCIQSCWAQVPDEAPRLLETSDRGELVLQPAHAVPLLVLDGLSGDTVISGTGRWLDPRVPAELATFEWTATGGRLDLGIVERTDVRLAAPGYRAVTLVLEAAEARRTVLLQPIAALELSVEPPVDGSLVLWPLDKVTPFSMLSEISQTHDLKAGESLAIDLGPGTTWLGAAIPREHAPIPLTIKALPARLELHLEPGLRVVGTVQDPDRAPISGSHVVAGGVLPEPHQVRYTQEATTDENGRFEILGLVAGEISLQACASGRSCHRWTMELDSESAPEPQEVVLQPGFDLELHLVDRDGLALEGVNITASDLHVTSDDHGKVRIPGVSTGQKLELAARGGSVVPWQGLVRVEGSPQVLELERGASLTWAILVPEGMASEDTAGNGISVMWERSRPADNQPLDNGTGRWDNASGQAVADGLRPGLIRMKVDIPGLATLHSEPVELQVGEAVMLPPAVPDAGRVIAGRVVSAATGELIAGAQLRLEQGDPTSFRPPGLRESARSAVSDEDGSFRVSGLGEGPYRVRAVAPGFAPTVRDGIEPGSTMDTIELGEGLSIEGVVVDRQGEPLGGSRVEVWETAPYAYEPETSSVADDNGAFALEHLPVGTWRLEVGAGGRTARKEVTGGEGEALDVELRLGGVRVDGVVLLGDTPAGPGTLVLQPPGARTGPVVVLRRGSTERFFGVPGQSLKAAVDGRGEFELTTVDPGRWIARFTPAAGGAPGADVELQIPDVEQGLVVGVHGAPVHLKILRGSKASRTASPTKISRLSMMARTKKAVRISHGACRLALPWARSSPNDGEPGGRPKPRKSSEVSVVIEPLRMNGRKVSVATMALGSRWRNMMVRLPTPSARPRPSSPCQTRWKPTSCHNASSPRQPGMTGSPSKWHSKNQRSGLISSSAVSSPLPYLPPSSEICVMRSSISMFGFGRRPLVGPNSSP